MPPGFPIGFLSDNEDFRNGADFFLQAFRGGERPFVGDGRDFDYGFLNRHCDFGWRDFE